VITFCTIKHLPKKLLTLLGNYDKELLDCVRREIRAGKKPDESILDNLAKSLAQILGSFGWRPKKGNRGNL
jgi:hypothetical protein